MRKTLFWFFSLFLFAAIPAVAQHGGHASGGHFGGSGRSFGSARGEQHERVAAPAKGEQRGGFVEHHGEGFPATHNGYHWAGGGAARTHWDGHAYDHDYFYGHWGREHAFYWGHCNWWGPRFGIGSYFWFGGGYWTIIDPVPPYWYDDEVYVEWVPGYGYALVNPLYPQVYFHVGVRF
jgi:hypothetical protein